MDSASFNTEAVVFPGKTGHNTNENEENEKNIK